MLKFGDCQALSEKCLAQGLQCGSGLVMHLLHVLEDLSSELLGEQQSLRLYVWGRVGWQVDMIWSIALPLTVCCR
jgi:hypothetical protein